VSQRRIVRRPGVAVISSFHVFLPHRPLINGLNRLATARTMLETGWNSIGFAATSGTFRQLLSHIVQRRPATTQHWLPLASTGSPSGRFFTAFSPFSPLSPFDGGGLHSRIARVRLALLSAPNTRGTAEKHLRLCRAGAASREARLALFRDFLFRRTSRGPGQGGGGQALTLEAFITKHSQDVRVTHRLWHWRSCIMGWPLPAGDRPLSKLIETRVEFQRLAQETQWCVNKPSAANG
jgi:hypothetical protein